jgi:uncharacterized protein (DUF302 family)
MIKNSLLSIYTTDVSVKEILDRIEENLKKKGVTVFARINHGEAARQVQLSLPDEEVLIFGNPQVGTALMVENPSIGIELPLKIVAWRENQKTHVAFQNLEVLAEMFHLQKSLPVIKTLSTFMQNLVTSSINVKTV